MRKLSCFFAAALLLLSARVGEAQTTCPPDHPDSRRLLSDYFTYDEFHPNRVETGLAWLGTNPATVPVLTDAANLAVCQQLTAIFGPSGSKPNWRWTAYKVTDRYLVAFRWVSTNGSGRLGFTPFYIFNAQFQQIGGFQM